MGDDLPGSGGAYTLADAKQHAARLAGCVAFTQDVFSPHPPSTDAVYWFHSKQGGQKSKHSRGEQNLFLQVQKTCPRDHLWLIVPDTVHYGDDLPGSGRAYTLADAKKHSVTLDDCVAFTQDVFRNPADGDAVYWFHSEQHERKSDKAPGQQNLFIKYTPGDVIFRSLTNDLLSEFNHTGLYVSPQEVYEWTDQGEIKRSTFEEFAKSKPVFIKREREAKVFPPTEVVSRARKAYEDPSSYHGTSLHGSDYDPFFQNCQHFTDWCKTGKKRSVELQRVKGGFIGGGLAAMAASSIGGPVAAAAVAGAVAGQHFNRFVVKF
jgi:hypothetical protein